MKTKKWNIYEELKTEEDIQAFIEASIAEAENDIDSTLLDHNLKVAAEAQRRINIYRDTDAKRIGVYSSVSS